MPQFPPAQRRSLTPHPLRVSVPPTDPNQRDQMGSPVLRPLHTSVSPQQTVPPTFTPSTPHFPPLPPTIGVPPPLTAAVELEGGQAGVDAHRHRPDPGHSTLQSFLIALGDLPVAATFGRLPGGAVHAALILQDPRGRMNHGDGGTQEMSPQAAPRPHRPARCRGTRPPSRCRGSAGRIRRRWSCSPRRSRCCWRRSPPDFGG